MNTLNLDQLVAQYAQKIIRDGGADIENLITKTLGVLQEQSVYACLLFLFSRTNSKEKDLAGKTRPHLYNLLKELPAFSQSEITDAKIGPTQGVHKSPTEKPIINPPLSPVRP